MPTRRYLASIALFILAGCGQKGPLTLEKQADRTGQQTQQSTQTPQNKPVKEQQPQ
ncbi:MAG: lipoprotein [Kangiellaceae bacterium]|nr:lipoprotein [Kangiellaceae bacterium]MCW9015554.1 lipoprotein [Kangiellaceae bacterium]